MNAGHSAQYVAFDPLTDRSPFEQLDVFKSLDDFDFHSANTEPAVGAVEWLRRMAFAQINLCKMEMRDPRRRRAEVEWVMSDDTDYPMSFENCCAVLDLNPTIIRARMLES